MDGRGTSYNMYSANPLPPETLFRWHSYVYKIMKLVIDSIRYKDQFCHQDPTSSFPSAKEEYVHRLLVPIPTSEQFVAKWIG